MSVTYTGTTEKGYEISFMYNGWVKMYLSIHSPIELQFQDQFDKYASKEQWERKFAEWGIDKTDYKIVNKQSYHTVHVCSEDLAEVICEKLAS